MGFFGGLIKEQVVQNIMHDAVRFGKESFVAIMSDVIVRWCRKHHEKPENIANEIARRVRG